MTVLLPVEAKLQLRVCVSPVWRLQGDAGSRGAAGSRDRAAEESELVPADALAGARGLGLLSGPEVPQPPHTPTHTLEDFLSALLLLQTGSVAPRDPPGPEHAGPL